MLFKYSLILSTPNYARLLLQLALKAETHILSEQCVTAAWLNCLGSPSSTHLSVCADSEMIKHRVGAENVCRRPHRELNRGINKGIVKESE